MEQREEDGVTEDVRRCVLLVVRAVFAEEYPTR